MTISEEGKALRAEVSKLRPDKRRRYSDDLRRRLLSWVERSMASGMTESECGHALGIKTWRFRMWRELPKAPTLALVRVEAPATELLLGGRPTLIAPGGYRVEGLALSEIVTLLRELA